MMPSKLAEQLDALILSQTDCARALQTTLEAEHQCLLSGDLEQLHGILSAKDGSAQRLSDLGRQMGRLCGGPEQMEATVVACGDGTLTAHWQALLQVALLCQQANFANGALLMERQARLRSLQHVINDDPMPAVYGQRGSSATHERRPAFATA